MRNERVQCAVAAALMLTAGVALFLCGHNADELGFPFFGAFLIVVGGIFGGVGVVVASWIIR